MAEPETDPIFEGGLPRLPAAPPPEAAARERALAAAFARFDDSRQGSAEPARPRRHRSLPRMFAMPRLRTALAATAVIAVASPFAWQLARERREDVGTAPQASLALPEAPSLPSRQQAPARSDAAEPARVPPPAPAPITPPAPMPPSGAGSRKAPSEQSSITLSQGFRFSASRFDGPERAPSPPIRSRLSPDAASQSAEPAGRNVFPQAPQSGFRTVREAPVSTFAIDVDTASYGFVRASLARNVLPPADAVRPEELINYFPYDYPVPASAAEPFAVSASVFPSPWAEGRRILRIGVKGYALTPAARPKANLVFLVDTSGSMAAPNRLPLVKQSLAMLLTSLSADDRVAIVAYAGQAGTVLEPTPASEGGKILAAIEGLEAGGATAGGEGLRQAYALAARNRDPAAINRVMIASDGDFNVGITDRTELKGFVEREREKGIFLSVLGFGTGNLNDALMQALAQNGNGTAAHIDTLNEARKVLVEEASATLFPIAKDVKIQVEFNPARVAEYRLIGYETRALERADFENDRIDAGEVGSGQTATALYEIVPVGGPATMPPLRYGAAPAKGAGSAAPSGELAFVKIRYKQPAATESRLIEVPVSDDAERSRFEEADADARFATAVAGFAEILRGGRWTGRFTLDDVLRLASAARGDDPFGYRADFLQLVRTAKTAQALAAAKP